ncbi:MAG TPA: hypothetical protein VIJ56_07995 [Acidimicrobiales bacterium]
MPAKLRQAAVSVLKGETALWPALAAGIVVAVASYCVGPTRGDLEVDVALASMATFLFGVLIAFTIARTTERLAVVQNLVSRNNASLLSILQLMAVFTPDQTEDVRQMIDHQLTDQIDYRLVDNHLATPSNLALSSAIIELDPQTLQQEQAYRSLLDVCIDITANRAQIEATTGQSLQPIEWIGLLLLLLILLSLIVVLPGGTLWGALIAGALAGTLVTLVVLLRKLDLLRWHEVSSIWEPTTRLFRSMGLHPYVPRQVIIDGRYRPTGVVRVVDYPDPYPNRSTKIVTLEDLSPGAPGDVAMDVEAGRVGDG